MIITTDRLILRPWEDTDAAALYEQAKSPEVGPVAGWPPHRDIENSAEVIKQILKKDGNFAICLKDNVPIGAIGLMPEGGSVEMAENEAELGYWIGYPFWSRGYMKEAVKAIIEYGFNKKGYSAIWASYYEGNERSKRVMEACGFIYQYTELNSYVELMNETRVLNVMRKNSNHATPAI